MKRVVITGATSGLGAELARQLAAEEGPVHLALTGRRQAQLEAVAAACRAHGATVELYPIDVRDGEAMKRLAEDFLAKAGGVDLVVANAGVGVPDQLERGDPGPMADLFAINVIGVVNTLVPFVPAMKAQGRGHLVTIASVAGFRALPGHAAYAASKRAVQMLMDGFAYDLERWGIRATTINPGFVESELTAKNRFHMPFLLRTDDAVRRIRRAIRRGKRVYAFPLRMRLLIALGSLLPRLVIGRVRG